MLIVERHHILPNEQLYSLCSLSKLLYNKCTFYIRQAFFSHSPLPSITQLVSIVQHEPFYKNLHNTKTAKQTIRKALADWSNFFKALKAYKNNPELFEEKPKPPNYKKRLAQVIFYNETINRKQLKNNIITPTNNCFSIKSNIKKFRQVIITPKRFGFMIDVQYEIKENKKSKKKGVCSIDLGINNLCAITSDQHVPLLINGRIIKSINQWFNKHKCKRTSKKRYFRIENYFHHVSKLIVDNCLKYDIGTIIIGRNKGWKKKINIGKVNNQKFCSIPFYNLIEKIKYKAKIKGLNVITVEEGYTSKASYLDKDIIPEYNPDNIEVKHKFSGRRITRGLYKASDGRIINADVNGSGNILRKAIQKSSVIKRLDRSIAAMPIAVNPLRVFHDRTMEYGMTV